MQPLRPITDATQTGSAGRLREHILRGERPDSHELAVANKTRAMCLIAAELAHSETFMRLSQCEQGEIILDLPMPETKDASDVERQVAILIAQWARGHHDSWANWALLAAAQSELGAPMRDDCFPAESGHDTTDWLRDPAVQGPLREFVRAMYTVTQRELEQLGVTEVIASRGVRYDGVTTGLCPFDEGIRAADPDLNTLSAFSLDMSTAAEFACPSDEHFEDYTSHSAIISAVVPASRIVALPTTGPGSTWETELVVMSAPGGIDAASVACRGWMDGYADRALMPYRLEHMKVSPVLSDLGSPQLDTPETDRGLSL
jgi:hypothetical protein